VDASACCKNSLKYLTLQRPWPWPHDLQNPIGSSVAWTTSLTKDRRNSGHWFVRYHANKLSRMHTQIHSSTHGRTHVCNHRRTTWKHNAASDICWRQRHKRSETITANSLCVVPVPQGLQWDDNTQSVPGVMQHRNSTANTQTHTGRHNSILHQVLR